MKTIQSLHSGVWRDGTALPTCACLKEKLRACTLALRKAYFFLMRALTGLGLLCRFIRSGHHSNPMSGIACGRD